MDPSLANSGALSPCPGGSSSGRRMDKSSVLQSAINFLKSHCEATKSGEKSPNGGSGTPTLTKKRTGGTSSASSNGKKFETDSWKPASLSYEEFAQLMLEVRTFSEHSQHCTHHFIVVLSSDVAGDGCVHCDRRSRFKWEHNLRIRINFTTTRIRSVSLLPHQWLLQ